MTDTDAILENLAAPVQNGIKETEQICGNCEDHLVFAMSDKYHEFSLGLTTVLNCLQIAEQKGHVPPLPDEWWILIIRRYGIQRQC